MDAVQSRDFIVCVRCFSANPVRINTSSVIELTLSGSFPWTVIQSERQSMSWPRLAWAGKSWQRLERLGGWAGKSRHGLKCPLRLIPTPACTLEDCALHDSAGRGPSNDGKASVVPGSRPALSTIRTASSRVHRAVTSRVTLSAGARAGCRVTPKRHLDPPAQVGGVT